MEDAIRTGQVDVKVNEKGIKLYYFPNDIQGNREAATKEITFSRSKATTNKAMTNTGHELLASLGWDFDTKAITAFVHEINA